MVLISSIWWSSSAWIRTDTELRLRDAQPKRIQHPVLRSHVDASSTHGGRAEMRKSANRRGAGKQNFAGACIERIDDGMAGLRFSIFHVEQITARPELHS